MKKIFFCKLVILFCLIFLTFPVFSQSAVRQPWWLTLEQGKLRFRNADYGSALLLFEDARRDRRSMYEQMERDLINLLSINEVRRIGDSLERIERYIYDKHYTAANAALEELYYRIPKDSLNNSANAALQAIGKLKDYPEAEYWIGEIFRIEGEMPLALSQYRKAYTMRELMEDPGFGVTLQYKISGILRIRQEYNEMERVLFSIINENDSLWTNARRGEVSRMEYINHRNTYPDREIPPVPHVEAVASFASQAMARTLENEGINRFLELYRYNNTTVEQAHRLLGFHYAVTGRDAEQNLMSAFLIQNTVIIEEITRRQFDFSFTNLLALTQEINKREILQSYVNEVEYYKTAYYLAASLFRNNKNASALEIWEFLASVPQAGEWHSRAVMQLRTPRLEPIVEMP